MQNLNVNIQKLTPEATIPSYAKEGDAALDLTATRKWYDEHGNVCYGTSLAIEIPEGFVGLLFPRSSNTKKGLILGNSVGVVDSGYRGEVIFKFKPTIYYTMYDSTDFVDVPLHDINNYEVGERVGQIIIMPYPKINFVEVDQLSVSNRGNAGFGSTGK